MSIRNQIAHSTKTNRYPQIFTELTEIVDGTPSILSFGCSTGKETNTLANTYFKESKITGYDISKKVIQKNIQNNNNSNITYRHNFTDLTSYDLIFAMSVLCRWPERVGEYSFETFSKTLEEIDKLLNVNGYLCIYNSKYLFTDTEISKKYKVIETEHTETGFVYKYSKDGIRVNNYPHWLFQKIIE